MTPVAGAIVGHRDSRRHVLRPGFRRLRTDRRRPDRDRKSALAGDLRAIQGANGQLPAGGFLSIGSQGNLVLTDNAPVLSDAVGLGQMIATAPNGTLSAPAPGTGSLVTLPAEFVSNTQRVRRPGRQRRSEPIVAERSRNAARGPRRQSRAERGWCLQRHRPIDHGGRQGFGAIGQDQSDDHQRRWLDLRPGMGTLGSYDINILGELSVAGRWVNNFGATATDYQTTAWSNGGSIAMFAASDVVAYFNGTTEVSSLEATNDVHCRGRLRQHLHQQRLEARPRQRRRGRSKASSR